MICHLLSDLHGFLPEKLPGGDLLIISGDVTNNDFDAPFALWIDSQPYKKIIWIAGNHDNIWFNSWLEHAEKRRPEMKESKWKGPGRNEKVEYLCDSGTEFDGLKIWGTPWSLTFKGINPKCTAFTGDEAYLKSKYYLIPEGIDILISHGPPQGILDGIYRTADDVEHVGSWELLYTMDRVKPKLLVTAHIHENGLQTLLYKHQGPNTMCVNASYVDERYSPRNAFMACEWDGQNFVKFDRIQIIGS